MHKDFQDNAFQRSQLHINYFNKYQWQNSPERICTSYNFILFHTYQLVWLACPDGQPLLLVARLVQSQLFCAPENEMYMINFNIWYTLIIREQVAAVSLNATHLHYIQELSLCNTLCSWPFMSIMYFAVCWLIPTNPVWCGYLITMWQLPFPLFNIYKQLLVYSYHGAGSL